MKKITSILMTLLLIVLLLPPINADASSGSVKVATYKYKGQPYVQIKHSNKSIENKINKTLKTHAVKAASAAQNSEITRNNGWYKSSAKTMYNKNYKLSVVFETSAYYGGAHDVQSTETFNFDTKTGKQISLKSLLNSQTKITRANQYVQYILTTKNSKSDDVYDTEATIDVKGGNHYFRDNGITIIFDVYEVAAYYVGRVDVTIPNAVLDGKQKIPTTTTSKTENKPTDQTKLSIDSGDILIYSNDGKVFLGSFSTNEFDSDSIFNEFGDYGSEFSSTSIWNDFGTYGSEFSSESAFNDFASYPPVIVFDGVVIGYLTTNEFKEHSLSPYAIVDFINSLNK